MSGDDTLRGIVEALLQEDVDQVPRALLAIADRVDEIEEDVLSADASMLTEDDAETVETLVKTSTVLVNLSSALLSIPPDAAVPQEVRDVLRKACAATRDAAMRAALFLAQSEEDEEAEEDEHPGSNGTVPEDES